MQPFAEHLALDRHVGGGERFLAEVELDLEPVGHHRFDLHGLSEHAATELRLGSPVAGRRIVGRLQRERVEPADRFGVRDGLDELSLRVVQAHAHRMLGRQRAILVLQHEGEVDVVARPPYPALAIDEALEAGLDLLAADVEMAGGQRAAAVDLEIAFLAAMLGQHIEGRAAGGLAGGGQLGETVRVGGRGAGRLILEVHHREIDALERLGCLQVGSDHPQLAALVALGDEPDVGGDEVARVAHARGMLVVGVFARILALGPGAAVLVLAVEVLGIIPAARLLDVEVLTVGERLLFARRHGVLLLRTAVGGVAAIDR